MNHDYVAAAEGVQKLDMGRNADAIFTTVEKLPILPASKST